MPEPAAPAGRGGREGRTLPAVRWGLGMVSGLLLVALMAPVLAPYEPGEQLDPEAAGLRPPGTRLEAVHLAGGDWLLADRAWRTPRGLWVERLGHRELLPAARVSNLAGAGVADHRRFLLGTDRFGRDIASRLLYGARISLAVGVLAALLALTVGIAVGSLAALGGPVLDLLLMRGVDAMLAFPWIFLLIALAALLRPETPELIVIMGCTGWMGISRYTRAELLSLSRRNFVLAARALGEGPLAVLFRHLLPNALTPVLVQASLQVGNLILLESALSFLGLGVQPPTASWGAMIADAHESPLDAWWLSVFPGAALACCVIAFNLLGDELRDTLDPHWRGAAEARR